MIEMLLVTILGTALGSLLSGEFSALLSELSRTLLSRGLRRLLRCRPKEARERLREEIEANFASYSERPLAGLAFALPLRWTARHRPLRWITAFFDAWLEHRLDELSKAEKEGRLRIYYTVAGSVRPMMGVYTVGEARDRGSPAGRTSV